MNKLLVALAALITGLFVIAPITGAFDILPGDSVCQEAQTNSGAKSQPSAVCQDKNNGSSYAVSGKGSLILTVTRLIAIAAGIAAVIMIIVSGFQFIFSGGESEKAASARKTLLYAVVGLVIIVFAEVIIEFVVSHV